MDSNGYKRVTKYRSLSNALNMVKTNKENQIGTSFTIIYHNSFAACSILINSFFNFSLVYACGDSIFPGVSPSQSLVLALNS